jgi:hypothetical protein
VGEKCITRIIQRIPANVRHLPGIETRYATLEDPESASRSFVACVEQQLQAETDTEARMTLRYSFCDDVTMRRERVSGRSKRTDSRQHENVSFQRSEGITLDADIPAI